MSRLPTDRQGVATALVVVAFLVVAVPLVVAAVPGVVGADASYVVLSSSMSPAIDAGDLVLVNDVPTERIEEGDVITFRRGSDTGDAPVTHRVVDIAESDDERRFTTKGDANEDPDSQPVRAEEVIGREVVVLPLVGYLVEFGNSRAGLATLVIVPAVLLGVSELWDLYREATGTDEADADGSDISGGDP